MNENDETWLKIKNQMNHFQKSDKIMGIRYLLRI